MAGAELASLLRPGDLVVLEGDLAAGKTVLVRGLAEALGVDPARISSPSFVLAIEHKEARPPLLHIDLYRLPEGGGFEDLGIEEALADGWIVAIEWGEKLPEFLRNSAWRVLLTLPAELPEGCRVLTMLPPADQSRR